VAGIPCFKTSLKKIIIILNNFKPSENKIMLNKGAIAKCILIVLLAAFFIPLFILPFFNHAVADDFICGFQLRAFGFKGYQVFTYKNWSDRYAATFILGLFASNNFLYSHYYLHTVLLVPLNILASFIFIRQLNKYVLQSVWINKNKWLISFVFVAVQIIAVIEPSTYFFWFSSAVTYQLPVDLFLFEVACWVTFLHTQNVVSKYIHSAIIILLIFIINGFNESFIVTHAALFILTLLSFPAIKSAKKFIGLVAVSYIVSVLALLFCPGIYARASLNTSKGVLTTSGIVIYHVIEVVWSIARNPIFWIVSATVFLFGNSNKEKYWQLHIISLCSKRQWMLPLCILCFITASITLVVVSLKGISPDRYINSVIVITVLLLLLFAFIAGVIAKQLLFQNLFAKYASYFFIIIAIAVFANSYFIEAYKSLFVAPLYSNILSERNRLLQNAAMEHKDTVVVDSYAISVQKALEGKYKNTPQTIKGLLLQRPSLIFFTDDLETAYSINVLEQFYNIPKIIVNDRMDTSHINTLAY
jgi:hypothetical protein